MGQAPPPTQIMASWMRGRVPSPMCAWNSISMMTARRVWILTTTRVWLGILPTLAGTISSIGLSKEVILSIFLLATLHPVTIPQVVQVLPKALFMVSTAVIQPEPRISVSQGILTPRQWIEMITVSMMARHIQTVFPVGWWYLASIMNPPAK